MSIKFQSFIIMFRLPVVITDVSKFGKTLFHIIIYVFANYGINFHTYSLLSWLYNYQIWHYFVVIIMESIDSINRDGPDVT